MATAFIGPLDYGFIPQTVQASPDPVLVIVARTDGGSCKPGEVLSQAIWADLGDALFLTTPSSPVAMVLSVLNRSVCSPRKILERSFLPEQTNLLVSPPHLPRISRIFSVNTYNGAHLGNIFSMVSADGTKLS